MGSEPASASPDFVLQLSPDEALVLFEVLSRLVHDRNGVGLLPLVEHDAELWALLRVQGLPESRLVEPLMPNYRALVAAARKRLVASQGPWPLVGA